MGARFDVFISYAHLDNSRNHDGRGWVDFLYELLRTRLTAYLGREPTIFLDHDGQVKGSSVLTPELQSAIENTTVLLPIVSNSYLRSDWCNRELTAFIRAAEANSGLMIGTKTRVLKVMKFDVGIGQPHTGVMAVDEALGYPFYQRLANGKPVEPPVELDPPRSVRGGGKFSSAVNKLAYDIKELVEEHDAPGARVDGPLVYLADASSDAEGDREKLRSELVQFGCTVLPAQDRRPGADYGERAAADLARSRFSIHIVGANYGVIPENETESIVELQYRIAGEERAQRPGFRRMLWMVPGVAPANPRQRAFIETLQSDPEFVVTPLEEFKTLVHRQLEPPAPVIASSGVEDIKNIYLIFEAPDSEAARRTEAWLHDHNFEVITPAPGGETRSTEEHNELLRACEGVLFYHGNTTETWLRMNLIKVQKAFATQPGRRAECGVVLADPEKPEKREFKSHLVQYVIPGFGAFSPDRLEGFAAALAAHAT